MKITLILSAFFLTLNAFCSKDTLVKLNDLSFRSNAEQMAFTGYASGNRSAIHELFISSYSGENVSAENVKTRIDNFMTASAKKLSGLNNTAKVKFLYKEVHKEFLKVYKLRNSFSDIFEKGEYNCVSASALYAIIFQEAGIPYQIIESPQHVYLIAFPASEKIVIETTSPDNGYFRFNNNYIEKYIKYMYESKLISKDEFETNSASALFDKYYFSSSGVSLVQLAGLQYSNFALYAESEEKNSQSLEFIKKACYLYDCNRHSYMLKSMLLKELNNNNYNDEKQINNFKTLCKFNNEQDKDVSNEVITNEFLRVLNVQLIGNSDYTMFEKSFQIIHSSLNDTAVKKEVAFIYHYELARLGYINYKSEVYELEHLKSAFKIKPKHANLQNMIFAYFSAVLSNQLDPQSWMKTMDKYANEFPFLEENPKFLTARSNCLLEMAYQSFSLNNVAKGETLLSDFEKIQQAGIAEPETRFVEKAYSVAAGIYYKKGNKAKTKEIIKRGLKYAPESFGLQQRLSQL